MNLNAEVADGEKQTRYEIVILFPIVASSERLKLVPRDPPASKAI
jgi:hypothetical protein